jgi:predicted esterase
VVLTYDPAGEGERNPERKSGTRFHDNVEEPPAIALQLGGLMITDVMQAVSYLASRPGVDATRIAAAGYSMGSFVLSLACAVETRLKACVLAGGGNLDGEGGYWDRSKPMCQGRPYQSLRVLGDRAAQIYALHAARGATLIYNGAEDSVVNIPAHGPDFFADLRRRVIALRGSDKGIFESRFLEGASHRPLFVTRPAAEWLRRQLDFPRWSAAEGETHIAGWAAAGAVEMDKLYATEHREGGTRAIGAGVPALSRTQLSVLSAEEWPRRQTEFSHEHWLRKARRSSRPEPRI